MQFSPPKRKLQARTRAQQTTQNVGNQPPPKPSHAKPTANLPRRPGCVQVGRHACLHRMLFLTPNLKKSVTNRCKCSIKFYRHYCKQKISHQISLSYNKHGTHRRWIMRHKHSTTHVASTRETTIDALFTSRRSGMNHHDLTTKNVSISNGYA